ncbi:hypothetical protein [Nonomuraea sp. NPDC050786]|uniref:hypothetical protein n=1 Tax=Nonomuraea sp. NPDC050786 TaxID=3154840 RepID=UPI0033DE9B3B
MELLDRDGPLPIAAKVGKSLLEDVDIGCARRGDDFAAAISDLCVDPAPVGRVMALQGSARRDAISCH